MADNSDLTTYIDQLRKTARLTAPAIQQAVKFLAPAADSRGLDAGCGIGTHTLRLAEAVGPGGHVTGADISPAFLDIARAEAEKQGLDQIVDFQTGDINQLPFDDDAFDWLWCCDCLWPGADGRGFNDPVAAVRELARVVKPGGKVSIVFWTNQMLLPGYIELENRLLQAFYRNTFYTADVSPERQFQRALGWLQQAGLIDTGVRCCAADFHAPLSQDIREGVQVCFNMFFGELKDHVADQDWQALQSLIQPESKSYLPHLPGYYGYLVYSIFCGHVA